PDGLTDDREEHTTVERDPGVVSVTPGADGKRREADDDGAEERHPTLPERNDVDRVEDVVLPEIRLLHDVVQAPPEQPADDRPDTDLLGDRLGQATPLCVRQHAELI